MTLINPFDPKAALLAKHAQHVVLVHFPIALFVTGAAFDFAANWKWISSRTSRTALAAAAYLNILMAAVFAVPTVGTGIAAWQWLLEGKKLKGVLLLHDALGCTSVVLIWAVAWIHYRRRRSASPTPGYCLALELAGVVVIALTGHLGGFLSGVNVPD